MDNRQQNWHEYLYPYRLANYRKRPLAQPIEIAILDYAQPISKIECSKEIIFDQSGTCDGVAIWVDYVVDNERKLRYWNGFDFPPFMTQNIRFFPTYPQVQKGNKLLVRTNFSVGDSDLNYTFQFA